MVQYMQLWSGGTLAYFDKRMRIISSYKSDGWAQIEWKGGIKINRAEIAEKRVVFFLFFDLLFLFRLFLDYQIAIISFLRKLLFSALLALPPQIFVHLAVVEGACLVVFHDYESGGRGFYSESLGHSEDRLAFKDHIVDKLFSSLDC